MSIVAASSIGKRMGGFTLTAHGTADRSDKSQQFPPIYCYYYSQIEIKHLRGNCYATNVGASREPGERCAKLFENKVVIDKDSKGN